MDGSARIEGLESAMKALDAAFPNNPKIQQQLVHGAMGGSARKSILPLAKQLAKEGDSSGALSEALKVRVQSKRKRRGKAGGMEVTPVRFDKKAIAKYIQHYYTARGKTPKTDVVASGIRHGHLVEFGHKVVRGGKVVAHVPAKPFLWMSAKTQAGKFTSLVAGELKKRIASRVKREARKRAKK